MSTRSATKQALLIFPSDVLVTFHCCALKGATQHAHPYITCDYLCKICATFMNLDGLNGILHLFREVFKEKTLTLRSLISHNADKSKAPLCDREGRDSRWNSSCCCSFRVSKQEEETTFSKGEERGESSRWRFWTWSIGRTWPHLLFLSTESWGVVFFVDIQDIQSHNLIQL